MRKALFILSFLFVVLLCFCSGIKQDRNKTVAALSNTLLDVDTLILEHHHPKDSIYTVVEQMPVFEGGDAAMLNYISTNWKIPASQIDSLYARSIAARFYIGTDGSVNDTKIVRSTHNKIVDSCFVEIIKKMPKWTSGKQNGKAVPVYFTIPMYFSLRGDR